MKKSIQVLTTAVLAAMLVPSGAQAAFHFMHISEIMAEEDADVQYFELVLDAGGQTQVAGSVVTVFNGDGSFNTDILTVPSNVANGTAGANILFGTPAFAAAAGVTPDFTIPAGSILAPFGMLCWGKPANSSDPNQHVDCVAFGGYTGTTATNSGTPSSSPPGDGVQALVRISDTDDNATDFALGTPNPCNNAGECGSIGGSTTTTSVTVVTTTTTSTSSTSLSLSTESTSTTIPIPICGNADNNDSVSATDALLSLLVAVGVGSCADCFCDVNSADGVTATDSLLILQFAVGQPTTLNCPLCTF